jgi:nicotinamide-nucleotide adenylyltransferase
MQKVGALVGRFQPLHNGHVEAVRFALTKVELLYIVVGSAEKSHEIRNPFTAGERMRMIKLALDESDVDCHRVMIVPIPDAEAHSVWVSYVDSYTMNYSVVFTNDPLSARLFQEKGVTVLQVPFLRRDTLSGTEVRTRISDRADWKKLVPKAVEDVIIEVDGEARISGLSS